jgi:hypothetical protein
MGKTHSFNTSIQIMLACFYLLFIVSFTSTPATSKEKNPRSSVISNGHSYEEIKRGQRFFMGFLPKNSNHSSCVSCHNLSLSDTLNWNPSALAIAEKFAGKNFTEFQQVIMQPIGLKIEEAPKYMTKN